VLPDAKCELLPVADGGEGTIDSIRPYVEAVELSAYITLLNGVQRDVSWLRIDEDSILIESAKCVGLEQGDMEAHRYRSTGIGELLLKNLDPDVRTMFVALGGTGMHDCGFGMAHALGFKFFDSSAEQLFPDSHSSIIDLLNAVDSIENPGQLCQGSKDVIAMCDVNNPLVGKQGAALTYGAQKGFPLDQLTDLDTATMNFAEVVQRDVLLVDMMRPGTGAAGGLGFAFAAFCGAELESGIDWVLFWLEFRDRSREADLVITGEGTTDMQTLHGKTIARVAENSNSEGTDVLVFSGQVQGNNETICRLLNFKDLIAVTENGSIPESKEEASNRLALSVENYFRTHPDIIPK
jgi:glycerate 2-kinase